MPTYEYECVKCHHRFDTRHGIDEKPELSCPECECAVKKVFSANGIIFKGSGWYVTDSASKPATAEK
ncbi:MAG: FmdB family zinc ribbon protein [bacterium]